MPNDMHNEETRRPFLLTRQHIAQRIKTLESEIEELNSQIAQKNRAVAMLIRARTLSMDKVRRSYHE